MTHSAPVAPSGSDLPAWDDLITAAEGRLAGVAHRTPVLRSRSLDARVADACGFDAGATADLRVFLKCEGFQRAGAFKFRGAWNAVSMLSAREAERGVLTHSSGNHAQALALAAAERGLSAFVVMPEGSAQVKIDAVQAYGAEIRFCAPTSADRERGAREWIEETGAAFIPPFDDPRIVAGQATAARELLREVPDLDLLLAPVGGGGLLAGTSLAAALHDAPVRVLGVEPTGADDAARSFAAGELLSPDRVQTIAGGLRTGLGRLPYAILRRHTEAIVTVSDEEIVTAMRWVWERLKIVVEPSAAVPVAALLAGRIPGSASRIGVILSGANVDLDHLPWLDRAPDRRSPEDLDREPEIWYHRSR